MKLTAEHKKILIYAGLAVGGYIFLKTQAGAVVAAVGEAINPVSDKNIFYRGVNAAGAAVTGTKDFSLGAWIYDATHAAPEVKKIMKGGT